MQNHNVKVQKEKFLKNEIETSAVFAGFARARIYKKDITEQEKTIFKRFIKKKLGEYGEQYRFGAVSENEHFLNIERFSEEVTGAHGLLLEDEEFRIGVAQKVLNLYLKYLWVLWDIKIFHCPFDSRVISQLVGIGDKDKCNRWTRFKKMGCYRKLVIAAKEKAKKTGCKNIAEWELELFNSTNERQ